MSATLPPAFNANIGLRRALGTPRGGGASVTLSLTMPTPEATRFAEALRPGIAGGAVTPVERHGSQVRTRRALAPSGAARASGFLAITRSSLGTRTFAT